ncbi:unnamed protein product [Caenorhabditis bovis]|uniref:Uncharacterized protein n=1 Tax=Caenorhabditis bovis TaxID=2654633 RepID=A0A8S1E6J6_9PELO|nr:unnamed protein product [Caenorhabditis bovis]
MSRRLQIFEIIISYFLPVVIITILDLKVILCRAVWFSTSPKRSHKAAKQKASVSEGVVISPEASMKLSSDNKNMSRARSTNDLNSSSRFKRRQQMKVLRRCLCITIFDLSMNLPSYLLRLYLSLVPENLVIDWRTIGVVEEISQVMYFAQFALNAVYLVCIIYDNPRKRHKAPSTQLSAATFTPRASCRRSLHRVPSFI